MPTDIDTQPVTEFVRSWLPSAPATILEVGAGSGEFARNLVEFGYDVTPIDPATEDDALVQPITLESLDEDYRFDVAVASRTLHHLEDLQTATAKLQRILDRDGVVIVNDFGWDKLNQSTAKWLYSLLPEHASQAYDGGQGESFADWLEGWQTEHEHLHRSGEMLRALREQFAERYYADCPWIVGEYIESNADLERTEWELITDGTIRPLGFRFVGQPAQDT